MPGKLTTAALAVSLLALASVSAIADEHHMSALGDWSGFYFGGHAGYIEADTSGFQAFESGSGAGNGGIFGAQTGYNIQAGELLIGFEIATWIGLSNKGPCSQQHLGRKG